MMVTFSSIADDDRAKLLLFPFVSGLQLALFAWCRPFSNEQASLLNLMETVLLTLRFMIFSLIATLLIFNTSVLVSYTVGFAIAGTVALVMFLFSLHVLAQYARRSEEEEEEEEEE